MATIHKAGVIGYGGMGRSWHPERCKDSGRAEVIAAYDINPERLEVARQDGIIACESAEQLLAMPEIDVIFIATPNNFHCHYAVMALEAGKNVVCEKPVMMNSGELEKVIGVMEKTGKVFSAHQNRRWDRDFVTIKTAIAEGSIGTPYYIESRVQGCRGIPGDWRSAPVAGGGMLYDWGIHLIDQIMWITDSPVVEVYAHLLEIKYPGVDDNFKLLLKFENGLSALVEIDTYCFIPLPRWHIQGDHGTLVVDDWGCGGKIIKSKTLEMVWEEGVVWTEGGPTKTMAPRPKESLVEAALPEVTTDVVDFMRNFLDAVEGKAKQIVTPQQSLRVMKVIDAAFKSSAEGICVKTKI